MLFDDVMNSVRAYFSSVDAKVAALDAEVALLTARGVATESEITALKATQLDPAQVADLLTQIKDAAAKLADLAG